MPVPFFVAANGDRIRSTPACDGSHPVVGETIYLHAKNQRLVALVTDGAVRWTSRPPGQILEHDC